MTNRVDRFGNPIDLGTTIAYFGTNVGLVIGVVVKLNPKSYKVKSTGYMSGGRQIERYYTVLFDASDVILTAEGLAKFDPREVLNELEMARLGINQ